MELKVAGIHYLSLELRRMRRELETHRAYTRYIRPFSISIVGNLINIGLLRAAWTLL